MTETRYKVERKRLVIIDQKAAIDLEVEFTPILLTASENDLPSGYSIVTEKERHWVAARGIPAGEWQSYHSNGKVKVRCFYELTNVGQSRLHGPCERYNESGMLISRAYYVNGMRQGREERFYADGARYAICFYRDGVPVGEHTYFYRNGNKRTIIPYPTGAITLNQPDGTLKREVR